MNEAHQIAGTLARVGALGAVCLAGGTLTVVVRRCLAARAGGSACHAGPGAFGLLGPVADGISRIAKHPSRPTRTDLPLAGLAALLSLVAPVLAMAMIPFGASLPGGFPFQLADPDSALIALAALLLAAGFVPVLLGYASNSRFGAVGAHRAASQSFSGFAAVLPVLLALGLSAETTSLAGIVEAQQGTFAGILPAWLVFKQPVAFLLFVTAVPVMLSLPPFDNVAGTRDLDDGVLDGAPGSVAVLYRSGANLSLCLFSALTVTLFFGGWGLPWLELGPGYGATAISVMSFLVKWAVVHGAVLFTGEVLAAPRPDGLSGFAWTFLVPAGMANLAVTAFMGVFS